MREKEKRGTADFKQMFELNIQKPRIMAFGPNTSWQIDEEKVEAVTVLLKP